MVTNFREYTQVEGNDEDGLALSGWTCVQEQWMRDEKRLRMGGLGKAAAIDKVRGKKLNCFGCRGSFC